ncbi:MAG: SAM hydrolase/SAM-dependent halogenase family protein [Candidatus Limnocylindria bacterium]
MQEPTRHPVIGFLTDFGLDAAAATCRAVMLSKCPDAQIVDIAHTIRKYAIRDGAFLLRFALPYFPVGVHVGVVDPGVGTARRPVAIRAARGDVLIGPDNGLLLPAADALGGVDQARVLENRDLWLPVTSSTFHGRDIFSPVAGRLSARSATFESVGPALPSAELVRLPEPVAVARLGELETVVTYVDTFGNLRLAGERPDLDSAFDGLGDGDVLQVEFGGSNGDAPLRESVRFTTTFGGVPVGAPLIYLDAIGNIALADNQGSIAARLGIGPDRAVRIVAG